MSLDNWALKVIDAAADSVTQDMSRLQTRYEVGTSFEKWTTARIAEAVESPVQPVLEAGYASFVAPCETGEQNEQSADLLLIDWELRRLAMVEAAIVLPGTQAKWKSKIAYDYEKLRGADVPHGTKILVVYSCSDVEKVLGPDGWDYWFEAIHLSDGQPFRAPDYTKAVPMGEAGEWALRAWVVPSDE